jgi:hypothetical protein
MTGLPFATLTSSNRLHSSIAAFMVAGLDLEQAKCHDYCALAHEAAQDLQEPHE